MRKTTGFTLVEVMVTMVVGSIVLYGIYLVMSSTYDSFQITTRRAEHQNQMRRALNILGSDIRQTSINHLTGNPAWSGAAGSVTLNADQAIAYSSARNVAGSFITESDDLTPVWQAIVVCCPFVSGNMRQLRRYRIFGMYDFPVTLTSVTGTQINVQDASGARVAIDRTSGAPGIFDVLSNNFDQCVFTGGNSITITLRVASTLASGRALPFWDVTSSATPRNQ